VDQALRELVDAASAGVPRGWAQAIRRAAVSGEPLLLDDLDRAIAGADLTVRRGTWWWSWFRLMQWLLIGAVAVGALWSFLNPVLTSMGLPRLPRVLWYTVPAGTWLLLGGLLAGVLLALLGRGLVEIGARAHARAAKRNLDEAIAAVAERAVLGPVEAELERHAAARKALRAALS
ncbi:MAG: ABC transporter, partial [Propionicimonas sp.]